MFHQFGRRNHLADRTRRLSAAADILLRDKARYAEMMTLEMGKPIAQAEAEVEKCASAAATMPRTRKRYLADEHIKTEKSRQLYPLSSDRPGSRRHAVELPVLAGLPFCRARARRRQCRLAQARFQRPAMRAGDRGDLPRGRLPERRLPDTADPLAPWSNPVIADDRVRATTLTGSEGAGSKVAEASGKNLKKTVLELGGSDPFIVMPSADIDLAIRTAVTARIQNTGQSCIASKRFIVHADVYDRFAEGFVAGMKALKVGDPMDRAVHVGPLATPQIRDELAEQVDDTVKAGAKLPHRRQDLRRARAPSTNPPCSPTFRKPARPISDELFGPVASVFRVRDIDAAIKLANATRFGLGSSVWTNDGREEARFVDEIEAGFTAINGMVASDSRLPFGGVKASGHGRELSAVGMREFLNVKTVVRS